MMTPREGHPSLQRPHRPARPHRRSRRPRQQPPLVLAPPDPRPLRVHRPGALGRRCARTRSRMLSAARRPHELAGLAADPRVRRARSTAAKEDLDPTSARTAGTRPGAASRSRAVPSRRSPTSAPSSASPRCCRSTPAASASSPATTSRRPPTSACRSSASACSTRPATSSRASTATAGSRRPTRSSTPTACRSPCCARRTAAPASSPSTCPAAASCTPTSGGPRSAGCRCCSSTPTCTRTTRPPATSPSRLYGGGGEQRLQQEMLLGMGGVRALRLWSRLTGAPTPDVYHTNEGHAGFLGVERIRELVPPSTMLASTRRSRPCAPPRSSPRTPRCPPASTASTAELIELLLRRRAGHRGRPVERLLAPRRRELRGRRGRACSTWPSWACGSRSAPTASRSCTASSAARCSTACGRASTTPRCRSPAITNGVHGPHLGRPQGLRARRQAPRHRSTSTRENAWERIADVPARRHLGHQARAAPAARRSRPAAASGRRGTKRGASPAELGWVDDILDPDVLTIGFARRVPTYKRLTLMLRDPERLKRLLLAPGAPGPAGHRRQVAPGRRDRQAAHPADGAVRRRPRGAPPHRLPAELRHRDGAAPLPGLRRLAEQPAAPVRGLRHVGHEGGPQRRPQPVDPRRLVGRVVRRQERLGHPDGRRRRGPRPPRRHRGRRALRPHRELRSHRGSTTATPTACRRTGSR